MGIGEICGGVENIIYNVFATSPIIRMPKELSAKERGINFEIFILESPSMARPISSGRGEAIMTAPIKEISQPNRLSRQAENNPFNPVFLKMWAIGLDKPSFINRKITKSPITGGRGGERRGKK